MFFDHRFTSKYGLDVGVLTVLTTYHSTSTYIARVSEGLYQQNRS